MTTFVHDSDEEVHISKNHTKPLLRGTVLSNGEVRGFRARLQPSLSLSFLQVVAI